MGMRTVAKDSLGNKLYWYRAEVVKVVDADTLDLRVDLGLHVSTEDRFRLYGIDAWETRGEEREDGLKAKQRVLQLVAGRDVWINTIKDKEGKYGRFLADVYVQMDDEPDLVNLNDLLVGEGHAEAAKY